MDADALAPYIARSAAAMLLIMKDKQDWVVHQLPMPSECPEMIRKYKYVLCFRFENSPHIYVTH